LLSFDLLAPATLTSFVLNRWKINQKENRQIKADGIKKADDENSMF